MKEIIHIGGVVVRCKPENISRVKSCLEQVEGVEVHGYSNNGHMVVTVESEGDQQLAETVFKLEYLPGVISASMTYHEFIQPDEMPVAADKKTGRNSHDSTGPRINKQV